MLTRLLVLLILVMSSPSWAAMAHVRSNCVSGNLYAGTNSYVYTYPGGAPTVGNLVIISSVQDTRSVSSVAGTGTTYTINGANTNHGAGFNTSQWKAIAAGSDTTVTVTLSGTSGSVNSIVCFAEFSGANSDQSGSTANGAANTATTTHNSGSVTPPTADNVVIVTAFTSNGADFTHDSDFTAVTTGHNYAYFAYRIQSAATIQEYNGTSGVNRDSGIRIGAFAGASSSAETFGFRLRVLQ